MNINNQIQNIFDFFQQNYTLYVVELFIVGVLLIFVSITGLCFVQSNILILFMAMELMLLGFSLLFISVSLSVCQYEGFIMALILLTLAAAEAAFGLAILVVYHRLTNSISLTSMSNLRG